jgi:tetratricopeptide (TPR) repeat protein
VYICKKIIATIALILCTWVLQAQDQLLNVALELHRNGEYAKAAELLNKLYTIDPTNNNVATKYTESLIGMQDYKTAEKICKQAIKKNKSSVEWNLLLANIYKANKEEKKATKLYNKIIDEHSNADADVKNTAILLQNQNLTDYQIALYQQARINLKDAQLYAEELATLYDKQGNFELATDNLLDLATKNPAKLEDVKTTLLRLFNDNTKVDAVRKKIIKRINEQPEVLTYPDILAWLYIQQHDYDNAFIQVKALDARSNAAGSRVLQFARIAHKEKEYATANNAFDYILQLGSASPQYYVAYSEKLANAKAELQNNSKYTQADVQKVINAYDSFFVKFPQAIASITRVEYAQLTMLYAHNNAKAISVLDDFVKIPSITQVLRGNAKLQLGDYYLIDDNHWEASLLYSQVDKDFKNDALGEEARFKNAKLSYFVGDYVWAQGQLDILKASTSELIANDALNLSVLITENMPSDSVMKPLDLFSKADLLVFQNKIPQALACLDSIAQYHSSSALQDDLLMIKATIASKQQQFEQAGTYYKQVYTTHKDDILADDALYQHAQVLERQLQKPDEAKQLYEQIILNYPGSTFITESRKAFRRLRGDVLN